MQVVEEQIVDKIRELSDEGRKDVLRYLDDILSKNNKEPTLVEKLLALSARVPKEDWDKVPSDGAEQLDHYIYGTRKR